MLLWRLGEALDEAGAAFSDAGELAIRAGHRLDHAAGDLADVLDELPRLSMTEAVIEVQPPASVNRTRGERWQATRRRKQQLQSDLHFLLLHGGIPRPIPGAAVTVTGVVRYPKRRRRDEGNIRAPLEKALGDALVDGGWLPDDTPEHFTFGELVFDVEADRPAMARLTLRWGD